MVTHFVHSRLNNDPCFTIAVTYPDDEGLTDPIDEARKIPFVDAPAAALSEDEVLVNRGVCFGELPLGEVSGLLICHFFSR